MGKGLDWIHKGLPPEVIYEDSVRADWTEVARIIYSGAEKTLQKMFPLAYPVLTATFDPPTDTWKVGVYVRTATGDHMMLTEETANFPTPELVAKIALVSP